jgi:hypothetical protein
MLNYRRERMPRPGDESLTPGIRFKKEMNMGMLTKSKAPLAILLALSLMALLTAAASANGNRARGHHASVNKALWAGTGQVLFVGPSQDPSAPTSATAKFNIRRGNINSVVITTQNEFVAGVLGAAGDAVTECKDRTHGATCETLNELLTGAFVSSLHTSTARLTNVTEGSVQVPIPGPGGVALVDIPVISGDIRGELNGLFVISKDGDASTGTASLKIKRGSSATYACFGLTEIGLMPLPSMESCVDQSGGQLLPIALNVLDRGSFEVGQGTGALSDIESIRGRVEVTAQTNGLLGQFGGTINVIRSVATLNADMAPELATMKSFNDDFDSEESYEEPED